MITVYIASPYTKSDVAMNVRDSLQASDQLVDLGFAPYAPLLSHFWHFLSPKHYETWIALDKEWVLRCDCVLRLPGESSEADVEVELAKENSIPVFNSVYDISNFYMQPKAGSKQERVEKYMLLVSEAIQRHLKWPSSEYTDIYSRAYEAVANTIRDYDTAHPKDWVERRETCQGCGHMRDYHMNDGLCTKVDCKCKQFTAHPDGSK